MPRALIIEFSLCGVGHDAGPPRTIRLGIIHISVVPRGFIERLKRQSRGFMACRRLVWLILQQTRRDTDGLPPEDPLAARLDAAFLAEVEEAVAEIHQANPDPASDERDSSNSEGMSHE